MGKLSKFSEHTFYGIATPPQVQGLEGEMRHSERGGQRYAYIIYRDASGIKWRIMPSIVATSGKISALRLYHRNSWGGRGFHSQGQTVWGTHEGLRDLITYIRNHEEYEASGRLDDHLRQRTEEVRHALRNLPETLLRETILSWIAEAEEPDHAALWELLGNRDSSDTVDGQAAVQHEAGPNAQAINAADLKLRLATMNIGDLFDLITRTVLAIEMPSLTGDVRRCGSRLRALAKSLR